MKISLYLEYRINYKNHPYLAKKAGQGRKK
jgi:hypothetical protein